MSRGDEGCLMALCIVCFLVIVVLLADKAGRDSAKTEFRECRTLLASGDSATVIRSRPACGAWTLPVREVQP